MSSFFALRVLLFAGEMLAGSSLIMALAWLSASQRAASARHLVWLSAFGSALVLPILLLIVPSPLRILLPAPAQEIPVQILNEASRFAVAPARDAGGVPVDPANIALLFGALWLVGTCALALRFATGALCLSQLKRRSQPFALPPEDLPQVAATRRECQLRLSDSENGPITWGVLKPVILLPRTAVFWPRERLKAVLLHELAHIRRRDCLAQALSHLACAFYWPNPLVWLAARRLRREAEIAADDAAIVAGFKPSRYAGELLQLAAEFRARRPAFSVSLFMAEQSALEARVESVLSANVLRTGAKTSAVVKAGGIAAAAALVIAFACPSLAQQSTSPTIESAPLPPPPAPPVPPAPEAPPAPDMPAVPAAPPALQPMALHHHLHALTSADRKQIHLAILRAQREAREAVARSRLQIERSLAQTKSDEEAMRAVREAQPEIDAAVAKATRDAHEALEKAKPEIAQAVVDAKINEHAMEAAREAEPAIRAAMDEAISRYDSRRVRTEVDRALAQAREEIAKAHIDETVQTRVNEALDRAEQKLNEEHMRGNVSDDETRDRDGNN